jgi:hypothetical protein
MRLHARSKVEQVVLIMSATGDYGYRNELAERPIWWRAWTDPEYDCRARREVKVEQVMQNRIGH